MDDTTPVANEVVRQHEVLARWLGSECDRAVLAELRASHTDDFSIVTTDGAVLTVDALFDALAGAGNAVPGLDIRVDDIEVVLATPEFVVTRFVEIHRAAGEPTRRRSTAVLRRDANGHTGFRWRYVHETSIS